MFYSNLKSRVEKLERICAEYQKEKRGTPKFVIGQKVYGSQGALFRKPLSGYFLVDCLLLIIS